MGVPCNRLQRSHFLCHGSSVRNKVAYIKRQVPVPVSELGAAFESANLPTIIHEKLYVKGTLNNPTIQKFASMRRLCDDPGDGRGTILFELSATLGDRDC